MLHAWDGKDELCFGCAWAGEEWGVTPNEMRAITQGRTMGSVEHLPLILLYELLLLPLTLRCGWRGGRGGRKSCRAIFELWIN